MTTGANSIRLGPLEFDHVVYDERADVLYLSIESPRTTAESVSTPDGHAIRYDEAGEIVGVTIVNAKWLADRDGKIVLPVDVPASALEPAFA